MERDLRVRLGMEQLVLQLLRMIDGWRCLSACTMEQSVQEASRGKAKSTR